MNVKIKKRKPRGWKGKADDYWYIKENGAYGVRYMCSECHRISLGIRWGIAEKGMHWTNCPRIKEIEERHSKAKIEGKDQ